jgi:hypothetical protein
MLCSALADFSSLRDAWPGECILAPILITMLAHPACSAPSIQLHPAHSNDAFRPVIPVLSGLNVLCHHVLCADVHHECVLLCALLLVFLRSLTLLQLAVLYVVSMHFFPTSYTCWGPTYPLSCLSKHLHLEPFLRSHCNYHNVATSMLHMLSYLALCMWCYRCCCWLST